MGLEDGKQGKLSAGLTTAQTLCTQTHTYLLPSSLFSCHTRQALFTEHPNVPTGWLGPGGTAYISGPIPAHVVSDLRDNYHTILNNRVFNVSQKKLVLDY